MQKDREIDMIQMNESTKNDKNYENVPAIKEVLTPSQLDEIKNYLDDLVMQAEEDLEDDVDIVPTKVYNLRSRGKSGVVNVRNSSKRSEVENRKIVLTYKSPYFSGSIDITEYDRVSFLWTCQINRVD